MVPELGSEFNKMADAGIKGTAEEYDTICGCCQVPKQVERTVTSDQIEMGAETYNDMDVFVSALSSAPAGNSIAEDYGLITMVVAKHRITLPGEGIQKLLERDMAEAERARALAIAKLRTKAKSVGANAVLAVKLDAEESKYGATFIHVMGNAVRLNAPVSGSNQWSQARPPPYLPFSIER